MEWRTATAEDAPLLARLNAALIAEEGGRPDPEGGQLEARMRSWLAGEYKAVLFAEGDATVAYALYRDHEDTGAYLRHFFVVRHRRREGIGSRALQLLSAEVLACRRIVVDAPTDSPAARAFWSGLGFREVATTFER